MPTLLLVGAACNCGAPGTIAEQIGLRAKKSGWECYMAHGMRYCNPTQLRSIAVSDSFCEKMHFLKSAIFDAHGLASTSPTKTFLKKIDKIKPDIIHLHNLHGYYINYKILFEYLQHKNIPILWTFHDFWPVTGHCCHFESVKCVKWKNGCFNCPLHKSYPKSYFDFSKRNYNLKRNLFTSVNKMKIITVSNWQKNLVKQSFLKCYPIETIYNGVDTDLFMPKENKIKQKYGIEGKKLLIAVAATWGANKGLYDYIELSKILPEDYVIMLIGIKNELKHILPANIIAVPLISCPEHLAEYYSSADVTLNLSYQETFGMTTVEGMACGTPGIVYNRTASPELVSNDTGKIVEAGNIGQVADIIATICSHDKSFYIEKCRNRVLEMFDSKKQYEKYLNVYDELLEK